MEGSASIAAGGCSAGVDAAARVGSAGAEGPAAVNACRALSTQHDSVTDGMPVSLLTARYPTSIDRAVALAFSSGVYSRNSLFATMPDLSRAPQDRTGVSGVSGQLDVVRVRQEHLRDRAHGPGDLGEG